MLEDGVKVVFFFNICSFICFACAGSSLLHIGFL